MGIFTSANFDAGTPGDNLTTDSAWENHAGNAVYSDAGRARIGGTVSTLYSRKDVAPASPDYRARSTIRALSLVTNASAGVAVRCQPGANTAYIGRGQHTTNTWRLERRIAGTTTLLGSSAKSFSASTDYVVELDANGSTLELFADGVSVVGPLSDGNITAAGAPGINFFQSSSVGNSTGWHLDSFEAEEAGGSSSGSGGSSSVVEVTSAGAGVIHVAGGSSSAVEVTSAGGGTASGAASGGSSSIVEVTSAGAGAAHVGGGSSSVVDVTSVGAGVIHAAGGLSSVIEVTAAGAGIKTEAGPQGGSSSIVEVTSAGAGVIHVSGGSSSIVKVRSSGIAAAPSTAQLPRASLRSIKKRAIPQPTAQQLAINTAVKERLEVICGERGTSISTLPAGATLEQVVSKINEILALLQ